MTPTETDELAAFLSRLTDDVARMAFSDWLDEHVPPAPLVELGSKAPKGLLRWWHARGHHKSGVFPNPYGSYLGARGWSGSSVIAALCDMPNFGDPGLIFHWLDHGGSSLIAGHPVLVGEPYTTAERALATAAELQRILRCPVSCSHRAAWHSACRRITVWFTFPMPG